MAPAQRLSGMQRQVLSLYREFLRSARSKEPQERRRIEEVVSAEFRKYASSVDRKDFNYIEYLLRRGRRQLDTLKSSSAVGLSVVKYIVNEWDVIKFGPNILCTMYSGSSLIGAITVSGPILFP